MVSLTTDLHGAVTKVQVEVLLVLDESGQYVAYCSALELSSYGDTEEEARQAFEESLRFFAADTVRRGTLDQLLLAFGWRVLKKPAAVHEPPRFPLELLNAPSRSRRVLTEELLLLA